MTQLVSKTVTPFLREHVPGLYAPVSKIEAVEGHQKRQTDPNSRYCYRHSPDSKCRRAADETRMVMIQSELDKLSPADAQAITTVWSLFSAAPSKHRQLMLQGVITQCCFPQLSLVSRECSDQLKIDFLTALPTEISFKILQYLDTVSLCKAAQVSRRWRDLADDDVVWHKMCEQHISRKCTKCGWGLPLLERKRLRDWTRQRELAKSQRQDPSAAPHPSLPPVLPAPDTPSSPKRDARSLDSDDDHQAPSGKRQCVTRISSSARCSSQELLRQERQFLPWKMVYRDRFKVGSNWKYGRYNMKIFRGHSNGVCCLQLSSDDSVLATGSYDATIKIWSVETGEEIRTLKGHTRGVRALQFDDNKLISGSLDATIRIWNWHTGECLSTLLNSAGILSVHFDGELLASGSIDHSVKVFNFDTKQTFCLRGHTDWVNQVRICPESRTVFSASDDCTVKVWDLDTKQCIRTYIGHVGHVQQCLLMPATYEPDDEPTEANDNTDSVSVSSGRSATGSANGNTTTNNPGAAQQENGVAIAPEDNPVAFYGSSYAGDNSDRPLPPRYMLTGGLDSTIRLWDVLTGKCLKTYFGHVEGIWGLCGDSMRVVSGANDGMLKIWDPRSGRCERTFTGHTGPVTSVALTDSLMASGSEDGEVRLYSFQDGSVPGEGTPGF
ncbi:Sulfur controller-2 protein [Pleurostoma richardsiae]|uniref:Sulfur controller-2 protein n=1 Tax=Pleurostoma richardsiae TaxID=41990 RepID=A0AA38RFI0_9PEZI|nr:Sulfur controller-2 protein [Pleurostoma richardsiae]